jgi:hypothetical protein
MTAAEIAHLTKSVQDLAKSVKHKPTPSPTPSSTPSATPNPPSEKPSTKKVSRSPLARLFSSLFLKNDRPVTTAA